jgi:hypothetical protein
MGWIFYFIFFLLAMGCYCCYLRYPIAGAPAGNGLRAIVGVTVGCYLLLLSVTLGLVFWCRARWGEGQTGKETHEEGTEKLVCLFLSVPCCIYPQAPQRRPFPVRRKHISLGLLSPICSQGGEQGASLFSVRGRLLLLLAKQHNSKKKQRFLTHSCSRPSVCVCVCACVCARGSGLLARRRTERARGAGICISYLSIPYPWQ